MLYSHFTCTQLIAGHWETVDPINDLIDSIIQKKKFILHYENMTKSIHKLFRSILPKLVCTLNAVQCSLFPVHRILGAKVFKSDFLFHYGVADELTCYRRHQLGLPCYIIITISCSNFIQFWVLGVLVNIIDNNEISIYRLEVLNAQSREKKNRCSSSKWRRCKILPFLRYFFFRFDGQTIHYVYLPEVLAFNH